MKKIISICLFIILGMGSNAQSFNQETNARGIQYVIGKFNKEKLQSGSYQSWFQPNFDTYEPNYEIVDELKNSLSQCTIKMFMGTWCGDSRREVPRFYKLLEACDFPMERLDAVALHLDREQLKQSPGGEEEGLGIHRVPTFIIYKDGKELGRIVEEPRESLEKDLLNILKGNYKESYFGVTLAQREMEKLGWKQFRNTQKKLARKLVPFLERYMELHTYSRVLYAAGKKEESYEILKLNQLLFPEEPNVYFNLGVYLWNTYQDEKAEEEFQKALALKDHLDNKEEDLAKKIAFIKENRKPQF